MYNVVKERSSYNQLKGANMKRLVCLLLVLLLTACTTSKQEEVKEEVKQIEKENNVAVSNEILFQFPDSMLKPSTEYQDVYDFDGRMFYVEEQPENIFEETALLFYLYNMKQDAMQYAMLNKTQQRDEAYWQKYFDKVNEEGSYLKEFRIKQLETEHYEGTKSFALSNVVDPEFTDLSQYDQVIWIKINFEKYYHNPLFSEMSQVSDGEHTHAMLIAHRTADNNYYVLDYSWFH